MISPSALGNVLTSWSIIDIGDFNDDGATAI